MADGGHTEILLCGCFPGGIKTMARFRWLRTLLAVAQLFLKLLVMAVLSPATGLQAAPRSVVFEQPSNTVEAYDFIEITLRVERPDAGNPFVDVSVSGEFSRQGGAPLHVEGVL